VLGHKVPAEDIGLKVQSLDTDHDCTLGRKVVLVRMLVRRSSVLEAAGRAESLRLRVDRTAIGFDRSTAVVVVERRNLVVLGIRNRVGEVRRKIVEGSLDRRDLVVVRRSSAEGGESRSLLDLGRASRRIDEVGIGCMGLTL